MTPQLFTPSIIQGLRQMQAERRPSLIQRAYTGLAKRFRGGWPFPFGSQDAQGGYVHDTAVSVLISPQTGFMTVGAWTDVAGAVAGTVAKRVTAAANSPVIFIPINPIQNSVALKGSYLKTIDFIYIIGT